METELKYKCRDFKRIVEIVKDMGFKPTKKKHQIDTYLIVSRKRYDGTWEYLRVREEKGNFSLGYHRVFNEFETEEREIEINDKEKMIEIMGFLGYEIKCVVDKKREEYNKSKINIVFDKIKKLGNFVEIEINGNGGKKDKEKVLEMVKKLGLDEKDRVEGKGYPDLVLEKKC